jgi:hypothetical protein
MMTALSRCVMKIAIHCLGDRRREWGLAMQGEFQASIADGKPLSFALGCLWGAWREMPADPDGRFALASYALAVGLVLPIAALLAAGAILGFPYLDFAADDIVGILSVHGAPSTLLNDGNRAAASSLSLVVLLLAGTSVLIAWAMLDRDWPRRCHRAVHGGGNIDPDTLRGAARVRRDPHDLADHRLHRPACRGPDARAMALAHRPGCIG